MIDPLLERGRHPGPVPPPPIVAIGTDQMGQYHAYARSIPGAFHRTWDMGRPSHPEELSYYGGFNSVLTSTPKPRGSDVPAGKDS
jgi:hypothetical protein